MLITSSYILHVDILVDSTMNEYIHMLFQPEEAVTYRGKHKRVVPL